MTALHAYLAGVRKRAESATEGPWEVKDASWDFESYWTVVAPDGVTRIVMEPTDFHAYPSGSFISPDGFRANGEFITAARTDVPKLLRIVEALESNLRVLREHCTSRNAIIAPEINCAAYIVPCDLAQSAVYEALAEAERIAAE